MTLPNLDVGGMETLAIALARGLRSMGHDVQFLLTQAAGSQAALVAESGMPVTVLSLAGKRPILGSSRLRAWLRSANLDVLHTHSGDWVKVAPTASGTRGLTIVHTQHGEAERDVVSRVLRWRAARHTDVFVAVSENVADQLQREAGVPLGRIAIVRNGVDASIVRPGDADAIRLARERMGLESTTGVVIGMVARMDPAKNHPMVLRAFARAHARHPDTTLVLIGDGPLDHEVRAVAAEIPDGGAIRFLGARPDVPSLLRGLDIVVLGSRTEGTSMTLLEAMASGVACVATDVGGTRALFDDGRYGVLVPDDDEAAFADALSTLIADAARRKALGESARQHVLANYSIDSLARRYEAIYRDGTHTAHDRD